MLIKLVYKLVARRTWQELTDRVFLFCMGNILMLPIYKSKSYLKIQKILLAIPQGCFYWFTFFNLFAVHCFSKHFQNASEITVHFCCCTSKWYLARYSPKWGISSTEVMVDSKPSNSYNLSALNTFSRKIIASSVNTCGTIKQLISLESIKWKWVFLFYIYIIRHLDDWAAGSYVSPNCSLIYFLSHFFLFKKSLCMLISSVLLCPEHRQNLDLCLLYLHSWRYLHPSSTEG